MNKNEYYTVTCSSKSFEIKITHHNGVYYLKVVHVHDIATISNIMQQISDTGKYPPTLDKTFSIRENSQQIGLHDVYCDGSYIKTVRFINGINSRSMIKTVLSLKNTDLFYITEMSEDEFLDEI
jgi:hypothetical protein